MVSLSDYFEDLRVESAAGFITGGGVVSAMAACTTLFSWLSIAVGGALVLYLAGELWGAERRGRWLLVHGVYVVLWCFIVASVRIWFLRR